MTNKRILKLECPHCREIKRNPGFGLEFYVYPCAKCSKPLLVTGNGMVALNEEIINCGDEVKIKTYIEQVLSLHLARTGLGTLAEEQFRIDLDKADTFEDFMDMINNRKHLTGEEKEQEGDKKENDTNAQHESESS